MNMTETYWKESAEELKQEIKTGKHMSDVELHAAMIGKTAGKMIAAALTEAPAPDDDDDAGNTCTLTTPTDDARALYAGGWRAADKDEFTAEYKLTERESDLLYIELLRIEVDEAAAAKDDD